MSVTIFMKGMICYSFLFFSCYQLHLCIFLRNRFTKEATSVTQLSPNEHILNIVQQKRWTWGDLMGLSSSRGVHHSKKLWTHSYCLMCRRDNEVFSFGRTWYQHITLPCSIVGLKVVQPPVLNTSLCLMNSDLLQKTPNTCQKKAIMWPEETAVSTEHS